MFQIQKILVCHSKVTDIRGGSFAPNSIMGTRAGAMKQEDAVSLDQSS